MLTSSVNNIIEESVACFAPISLAEMGSVKLMNRIDTKYVVPKILLPAILHAAIGDYFVQEIDSKRVASYELCFQRSIASKSADKCDSRPVCGTVKHWFIKKRNFVGCRFDCEKNGGCI